MLPEGDGEWPGAGAVAGASRDPGRRQEDVSRKTLRRALAALVTAFCCVARALLKPKSQISRAVVLYAASAGTCPRNKTGTRPRPPERLAVGLVHRYITRPWGPRRASAAQKRAQVDFFFFSPGSEPELALRTGAAGELAGFCLARKATMRRTSSKNISFTPWFVLADTAPHAPLRFGQNKKEKKRTLEESDAKLLCKIFAVELLDGALFLQVALVAHHDDRDLQTRHSRSAGPC